MTALAAYERLEAEGRYAATPDAAECEVLVKFGDASLMIMTFDETPIDHWPLASLVRTADGGAALSLAPDAGARDRLRLDDPAMVAAILEVCAALSTPGPSRMARLRRPLGRVAALAAAAGLVWAGWAATPAALDRLAAGLPVAARAALGEAAIAAWPGGRVCDSPAAARALAPLATRLSRALGGAPVGLRVLDAPDTPAAALAAPGGRVALLFAAIDRAASPAAVAEAAAAALTRDTDAALTRAAVREAGLRGALGVLRGDLAVPRLARAAAGAMARPGPDDAEAARALLAAAGLDDPAAAAGAITPAGWRALKAVCDR